MGVHVDKVVGLQPNQKVLHFALIQSHDYGGNEVVEVLVYRNYLNFTCVSVLQTLSTSIVMLLK